MVQQSLLPLPPDHPLHALHALPPLPPLPLSLPCMEGSGGSADSSSAGTGRIPAGRGSSPPPQGTLVSSPDQLRDVVAEVPPLLPAAAHIPVVAVVGDVGVGGGGQFCVYV